MFRNFLLMNFRYIFFHEIFYLQEVKMSDNLLSLKNVSKEYSGNKVLKNINIELKKGEIHALIGENGAGKSTLMNILFGMPVIHTTGGFEGTIEIEGKAAAIKSPHDAMAYGVYADTRIYYYGKH